MSDVNKYYSSGDGGGRTETTLPRHNIAIQWLRNKNIYSLLDIGCANGIFLEKIKKLKSELKLEGIELNPNYSKEAKGRGFSVKSVDVTGVWPYKTNEFDVIHISAVLEHLFDYKTFFEEANRCLSKNGYLIVSGPNVACLKCRLELLFGQVPCWYRNFEHIRLWTKGYLAVVAKDYNFKLIDFYGTHSRKSVVRSILEKVFPTLCTEFVAVLQKVK